jgi:hypothetical protein
MSVLGTVASALGGLCVGMVFWWLGPASSNFEVTLKMVCTFCLSFDFLSGARVFIFCLRVLRHAIQIRKQMRLAEITMSGEPWTQSTFDALILKQYGILAVGAASGLVGSLIDSVPSLSSRFFVSLLYFSPFGHRVHVSQYV